jgi:AAA family ATP:ADP antiporter
MGGISAVIRSPYLLAICAYLFCHTITATFLYFQQAEIVPLALGDERAARTVFLARIDLVVNVLTAITQIFLTGRVLKIFGVAVSLAALPLVCAAGFLCLSVWPTLTALAIFQVLRRSSNYAISRPGREVLYTVLPREEKYKAKHLIDTFVYRAGDQVGAWSYAGARALGLGMTGLSLAAAPLSVAWLGLAVWLGKRQKELERESV